MTRVADHPLQVAETALLEERRALTKDEVMAVAALPLDELPDLVALAHKVRVEGLPLRMSQDEMGMHPSLLTAFKASCEVHRPQSWSARSRRWCCLKVS